MGRNTKRKARLLEVLESRADAGMLLDEARWLVEGERLAECRDDESRRSVYNSFARTVREQISGYVVEKIPVSPNTPIGLLARVAVFRIRDAGFLQHFLNVSSACILCRYKTNLDVDAPRYEPASQHVVPHFHAATFRFFDEQPSAVTYESLENTMGTFIPTTQKLTAIVREGGTLESSSVSRVPWRLFGSVSLDSWFDVSGTDPLRSVHRS